MDGYEDTDVSSTRPYSTTFKAIYIGITQLIGITMVVMVATWLGNYCGGFAWSTPELIFNYHPLFMFVGMIFLLGNALTVHRIFNEMKRQSVKIVHAALFGLALVFAAVALTAVFVSNNQSGQPNLYSLHSWFGVATLFLFICQWVAGFVILLLRRGGHLTRVSYKSVHVFFGCVIFGMAVATALLGTFEYVQYIAGSSYSSLPSQGLLVNFIGFLLALFTIMIIYAVTSSRFRGSLDDKEFHHLSTN